MCSIRQTVLARSTIFTLMCTGEKNDLRQTFLLLANKLFISANLFAWKRSVHKNIFKKEKKMKNKHSLERESKR